MPSTTLPRRPARVAAVVLLGTALIGSAACSDTSANRPASEAGAIEVVAAFYAAETLAREVGGDRVNVRLLGSTGADPHHIELTPDDVIAVADAQIVVAMRGFQPAVDEALAEANDDAIVDLATVIDLRSSEPHEAQHKEGDHEAAKHDEADQDEADRDEGDHDHGPIDFHFWLDPTLMSDGAVAVRDALVAASPDHREEFDTNLATFQSELGELDTGYRDGLATCERGEIVTTHRAFGYLADRYDFIEDSITGLTPEDEPSPAALERLADHITDSGITTVFFETLANPAIARTLAEETGATTAVLDPIEGVSEASPGTDYVSIMTANLAAIRTARGCQ